MIEPCDGRRGGAVATHYRFYNLRFLDSILGVARPDTLLLSRSRYLMQSLASIIAASGRDDYVCA
eukprot:5803492-Pleurochrysis_carterae.AAC.1